MNSPFPPTVSHDRSPKMNSPVPPTVPHDGVCFFQFHQVGRSLSGAIVEGWHFTLRTDNSWNGEKSN